MTYKEKAKLDFPERIDPNVTGGVRGCPHDCYKIPPVCLFVMERGKCLEGSCAECWDRECPDTVQKAARTTENALKVMLDPGAKMPTRGHETDAGLDLYSPIDATIYPANAAVAFGGFFGGGAASVCIDTGVHVAIPEGYVGDVKSKSGLMMDDDIITDGTVDSGYTGSIRVKLFNLGVKSVYIKAGQKIAQLVIKKIITPEPVIVDSLEETERGNGGFGSTGKF